MKQYSIDLCEFTWAGLNFKEGLADGSSLTPSRANPSWSQVPYGATTEQARSRSTNRSGQLTILVMQTSQLHQQLKGIANRDRLPGGKEVFPFVVKDNNSGDQITFKNTYIATEPDQVRATTASVYSWVFNFEDFTDEEIPRLSNVVGN